jgi:hypothetical protein
VPRSVLFPFIDPAKSPVAMAAIGDIVALCAPNISHA